MPNKNNISPFFSLKSNGEEIRAENALDKFMKIGNSL
jgi:hypothetical protein